MLLSQCLSISETAPVLNSRNSNSESVFPPEYRPPSDGEQYPSRDRGSQYCCAVTAQRDHTVEPAELQPVLDREPEAMREVEQREHAHAEQEKFGQRVPHERQQVRVVGRVEQSERKRNSEQ